MSKLYDLLEQIVEKVNKSVKFEEGQILTDTEKRIALNNLGLSDLTPKTILEPEATDIPKVFIDGVIPTTKDDVLAELTYISKTLQFHSYITINIQELQAHFYENPLKKNGLHRETVQAIFSYCVSFGLRLVKQSAD